MCPRHFRAPSQMMNMNPSFHSTKNSFNSLREDSTRSSLPDDQYESATEGKDDVFDIPHKNPPPTSLQRWKRATLALNAARRFRYTADVERLKRLQRLRTGTHAVRAVKRFQKVLNGDVKNYTITPEGLAALTQEKNLDELQNLGGVQGLAEHLKTSLERGIDDQPGEFEKRQKVFGPNTYPRQPPRNFFHFFLDACKDPTLVILMFCALLSLIFGIKSHGFQEGWYDGASIAFAVILVVLVTSISDYRQALQFRTLNEEKRNIPVHVFRGGRRVQISIFDVVVGDVVVLGIGDQVPADGVFIDGHALCLDESSMTGESDPVYITHRHPFLLSGCKVADGYGRMLVTSVGMRTEWGALMAELGEDTGEETPLQVRLNGVATFVGQIGLAVAALVFVILLVFYFVGHREGSNHSGKFKRGQTSAGTAVNSVVDIFAIAVTIVVVAVPEGLPLAVTLSLAYAMKKMMADKALVRRLSACETMGSATCICTDKTGTLTLNQMTVVKAWAAGDFRDPIEGFQGLHKELHNLIIEGVGLNTTAGVFVSEGGEPEITGSPTEKAVLSWGLKIGVDYEFARRQPGVIQVETFSSVKKRAGIAVRTPGSEKVHVHWKGAAEIVVGDCHYAWGADNVIDLDEDPVTRKSLMNVIESMAAESLRCIAFAYRELDASEVPSGDEQLEAWKIPEGNLTLLAIVGIKDPCRPGVFEAVQQCQQAGVTVRMVTGDNIVTAKAIAMECGILKNGNGIAIEGVEFRSYSDEERRDRLPGIAVMARSAPSDKLLMVRALREMGEVVAVTGDGTNDAPALHEADIGLAMGIQGTEVAKESSDIIILDDNFATVVKVICWGRSIYLNIQKFIQFQLTVNVAALTINFVAAVSNGDVPLTAVQLLWVNLIMDTLGALALATEPPTDDLLQRPPVGRKEPLISNVMMRNLLLQAVYQIVILLTLQFRGKQLLKLEGPDATDVKNTIIFNAFVLCQLFNEVNARKPEEKNIFKGLFNNHLFVAILSGTAILQVIIVEFLNKFASTVKISWQQWLICIIIGLVSWPIALIGKFIPVPKKPLFKTNFRPCWKGGPG